MLKSLNLWTMMYNTRKCTYKYNGLIHLYLWNLLLRNTRCNKNIKVSHPLALIYFVLFLK